MDQRRLHEQPDSSSRKRRTPPPCNAASLFAHESIRLDCWQSRCCENRNHRRRSPRSICRWCWLRKPGSSAWRCDGSFRPLRARRPSVLNVIEDVVFQHQAVAVRNHSYVKRHDLIVSDEYALLHQKVLQILAVTPDRICPPDLIRSLVVEVQSAREPQALDRCVIDLDL